VRVDVTDHPTFRPVSSEPSTKGRVVISQFPNAVGPAAEYSPWPELLQTVRWPGRDSTSGNVARAWFMRYERCGTAFCLRGTKDRVHFSAGSCGASDARHTREMSPCFDGRGAGVRDALRPAGPTPPSFGDLSRVRPSGEIAKMLAEPRVHGWSVRLPAVRAGI
jgi:hypothetical protein